jgi:murein DD-endopeptidase MepM/ murein hydrolase activator NlpD
VLTRVMLGLAVMAAPALAIELELPIACDFGKDCTIQQYPDRDAGPGVRDYACGAETYDGHDGTDIRIKTFAGIERGVAVLAAAAGVVKAGRDGMADRPIRNEADRKAIKDRECGNGVVVDHGDGWETQYCHLRKGSVAVKKGQRVKPGTKLGEVGISGDAAFAHVHLTVRKDGKAVDPFAPETAAQSCGMQGRGWWSAAAAAALVYRPGEVLDFGFAGSLLPIETVETGLTPRDRPQAGSGTLVAYGWLINLQSGDILGLTLSDGQGEAVADNTETLDRDKAQYLVQAGRKRLKPGSYSATLTVTRQGVQVISAKSSIMLE